MKFLKNRKKSNNKGFSLIELIIVIAIMAVLVGTLAPQYIRYVEKSRLAADATTIENAQTMLEVIASSADAGLETSKTYTISFDTNGKMTVSDELKKLTLYTQLMDSSTTYTLKSTAWKKCAPQLALTYTNSLWTVKVSSTVSGETLPTTAE